MQDVKKSALVPYACSKVFEMVTDINAYPEFIKWCNSAEILEREELDEHSTRVVARLGINYNGIKKSFTTENTNINNQEIKMQLHTSSRKLLSSLQGGWYFTDLGEGTKIELDMQFDMANAMLRNMVGPMFSSIVGGQLDAFVARAQALAKLES